MNFKKILYIINILLLTIFIISCTAGKDNTGLEYAPQMYHSTPYEPLSQITDEEAGRMITSSTEEEHAEFYNSNRYNSFLMTMRTPVEGTIKRGETIVKDIDKNDYDTAALLLKNPTDSTKVVLNEGKQLYQRFCQHCHGAEGNGDGLVGKRFLGVTSYSSSTVVDKPEGHIYHVITHGKGRMGAHASQLSEMERWKIVRYVQILQNK